MTSSPTQAATARPSALRWVLGVLAALLLVLAAGLAWLTWNDWNRSRDWVSEKVSQAIGREFAIRGPLDVDWQWPQQMETGWRRWILSVTVPACGRPSAPTAGPCGPT